MKLTRWTVASLVVLVAAAIYHFYIGPLLRAPTDPAQPPENQTLAFVDGEPQQIAQLMVQRMNRGGERINASSKLFGVQLVKAMTEPRVDGLALQQSYEATLATIRDVRTEFMDEGVPSFALGKTTAKKYVAYLNWQEKVYLDDMGALVVDFKSSASAPLERQNAAKALFTERTNEENARKEEVEALKRRLIDEVVLPAGGQQPTAPQSSPSPKQPKAQTPVGSRDRGNE